MVVQIRVDCGFVSTTTRMHIPTFVDTYLQYTHTNVCKYYNILIIDVYQLKSLSMLYFQL